VLRLLPLALVAALLIPAGRADAKVKCDSGKTVFTHGRTRVFTMYHRTYWYVCSATLRKPRWFAYGNDGSLDDYYGWKLFGHRLAFEHDWVGGDDLGWTAGWVDLHTGKSPEASMHDFDIPFNDHGQAIAVAPDGSVAALQQEETTVDPGQVIVYAQFGKAKFHRTRLLKTIDAGDVDPKSLAIANGFVVWTTTSGVAGSVPIG